MAQAHGDRLTAMDASFLAQESPVSHMHVGAALIFDGPPPAYDAFCDHIRGRLHLVPRYRQKLAVPPLQTGRPLWVDDASFNLEYHVRHTALPAPGSEEQLCALAARVHSQQLDRSKPLWEVWLVAGPRGRPLRAALQGAPRAGRRDRGGRPPERALRPPAGAARGPARGRAVARPPRAERRRDGDPRPARPGAHAVRAGRQGAVGGVAPRETLGTTREVVEGLGEIVWAGLNPAPDTPLNVPIGPHRRLEIVRGALEDFKLVKNTFGGTVNDVVLAVTAGALRTWLRTRGVRTEGLELRALVPVSIRADDQHDQLGNRLAVMRGPLPVYVEDPVARLRVVRHAMAGLKESKQAVGAEVLTSMQSLAPPTVLAQASRLNFSTRLFNLIVTNIPGPQIPLYVLGRQLRDLFPIAFLPRDHALAIAIMSYDGGMDFGLLGDYDAMADLATIGAALTDSLAELVAAAQTHRQANGHAPGRTREPAASRRAQPI